MRRLKRREALKLGLSAISAGLMGGCPYALPQELDYEDWQLDGLLNFVNVASALEIAQNAGIPIHLESLNSAPNIEGLWEYNGLIRYYPERIEIDKPDDSCTHALSFRDQDRRTVSMQPAGLFPDGVDYIEFQALREQIRGEGDYFTYYSTWRVDEHICDMPTEGVLISKRVYILGGHVDGNRIRGRYISAPAILGDDDEPSAGLLELKFVSPWPLPEGEII